MLREGGIAVKVSEDQRSEIKGQKSDVRDLSPSGWSREEMPSHERLRLLVAPLTLTPGPLTTGF